MTKNETLISEKDIRGVVRVGHIIIVRRVVYYEAIRNKQIRYYTCKAMKRIIWGAFFFLLTFQFVAQTTFSCTSAGTTCPCTYGSSFAEFYAGYHSENQSYFSTTPVGLSRNDATINYTADNGWGSIIPPASGSAANPDTYSTRWSGRIYLAAGTYTFWLTSDDGSYFWLGGNALVVNPTTANSFINNGGLHSPSTVSSVGIFTTNCLQDFKLHFGENGGNNRCALEYACTSLGIARQAVPSSAFCPCMSVSNLPIELKDFYGTANKDNVVLRWSTASEKDNLRFNVYKSGDGISWVELGSQDGLGSTAKGKNYSILDNSPLQGINYYYLSQTDMDGTVEKFDVITVDFNNTAVYLKLYPNPFNEKFIVSSTTEWQHTDVVSIFNALGLPVNVPVNKINKYNLELNTAGIPKGNYIIKIQSAYQVIVKRMVKD